MIRRPHWRKMTWVLLLWSALIPLLVGCGAKNPTKEELARTQGQIRDAQQKLQRLEDDATSKRAELSRLQRQIDGANEAIASNTIPGTGTFVVGEDIQPGTYRADAQPGCYWARLASLTTSDIIDNDNADGPVVVQILPSDKAFEAQDCADFHKTP